MPFNQGVFPFPSIKSLMFTLFMCLGKDRKSSQIHRNIWLGKNFASNKLIDKYQIDMFICAEDGISGNMALLSCAKNRRLPIVDIPFGNGTTKEIEISLKAKLASNELIRPNGWRKVILQLLSNKWLKRGEFKGATIFPTNVIFALESFDVRSTTLGLSTEALATSYVLKNPKALNRYQQEKVDSKSSTSQDLPTKTY